MKSTLQYLLLALGVVAFATGCEELRIDNGLLSTNGNAFQCASNDDCLEGYLCQDVGESTGVCSVSSNAVDCSLYNLDRDDYLSDLAPEQCQGLRGDCDDNDPLTYPGADEVCDGSDNNCNGIPDTDVTEVPPFACERQFGVCRDSMTTCTDTGVALCSVADESGLTAYDRAWQANGGEGQPFQLEETLCDGLDNDCDGQVDEGCCQVDRPFISAGQTQCDGLCNSRTCRCQAGQAFSCSRAGQTCERGVIVCDEDGQIPLEEACMAVVQAPISTLVECDVRQSPDANTCAAGEVCVNEYLSTFEDFADTCVNAGDPGCERGVCRALETTGTTCGSDGDCEAGETCFESECRPAAPQPATAEICNGLDDDCDGQVDEGFPRSGDATCNQCPFNMVRKTLNGQDNCVDRYEASRWDATADDQGESDYYAVSRPGVMPWTGMSRTEAATYCSAAIYEELDGPGRNALAPRKFLCSEAYWARSCGGPAVQEGDYNFGSDWQDDICVDGRDGVLTPQPGGSRPDCRVSLDTITQVGLFDGVGNVWEWVAGANVGLMGGSYAWPQTTGSNEGLVPEEAMTCRPDFSVYNGPAVSCADDAECVTNDRPFGRCNGGTCEFFMDALPDSQTGDWSDYENVGFRCCAVPG